MVDLLRNIRRCDPVSLIVVRDGGAPGWLDIDIEAYGAIRYPNGSPTRWGRGAGELLRMLGWVSDGFDLATWVDSDQLCLRPGYLASLLHYLRDQPRFGVLSREPTIRRAGSGLLPVDGAFSEAPAWRRWLNQHGGARHFCYWSFGPATVYSMDAMRMVVDEYRNNGELRAIVDHGQALAQEEIIPATAAAVLGFPVLQSPHSHGYLRYQHAFSAAEVAEALRTPDAFWIHPIARRVDDPIRRQIREALG